jgi:ribA/ribD-fused uncharacterized protein
MSKNTVTLFFSGPFSQWYSSPFETPSIFVSSYTPTTKVFKFANCEQYMMFEKAILFQDFNAASAIMSNNNPKFIKGLGRKVKNFEEKTWEAYREIIVYNGNLCKFKQSENLKQLLLSTGTSIIAEASPYDKIWGIGLSESDPYALDQTKWKGLNLLGKSLMNVRKTLSGA